MMFFLFLASFTLLTISSALVVTVWPSARVKTTFLSVSSFVLVLLSFMCLFGRRCVCLFFFFLFLHLFLFFFCVWFVKRFFFLFVVIYCFPPSCGFFFLF